MASNLPLFSLIGRSWDDWDAPATAVECEPSASYGSDQQVEHFPTTLPTMLMPLFGSYPVDDTISLITCDNCKFRFRTQTADYHIKNCFKKKSRKSPPVSSRASSLVDKGTKLPSVVVKVKPVTVTNHVTPKQDNTNGVLRALPQSPKVGVQNLVPPLLIKREPTTDTETAPTYKTQAVKQYIENEHIEKPPAYFTPPPLDFTLEKHLSYNEVIGAGFQKKVQEPREKKIIPLKDRHFNPEEHCGVPSDIDGRPCTRSLTCKTHSIALRRNVAGRSKCFDLLLANHKKSRDKTKLGQNGHIDGNLSVDSSKAASFDGFPTTLPDAITSQVEQVPRREPIDYNDYTGNLEVIRWSTPGFDRKYLGSVNTRLPITSLRIDRQLDCEQKVLGFGNSSDLILGRNSYINAYSIQNQNSEEPEPSEDFEEECWTASALEKVKVPRPSAKPINQNKRLLEKWGKGELSQLALLEEGISSFKSIGAREESGQKKELPSVSPRRLPTSSAQNPLPTAKRAKNSVQDMLSFGGRLCGPFKYSPKWKNKQNNTPPISQQPRPHQMLAKPIVKSGHDVLQVRQNKPPYDASSAQQTQAPAARLDARISPAGESTNERNENLCTFPVPNARRDGEVRKRNLSKSMTSVPGEVKPTWTKQSRDMPVAGAGQRSPHDGPVSDSELNNLLAAQFEDLDF